MAVPYTFSSATASIPLSQLDSNFATTITLGNTAIQLGNTVTTLNNMTLVNTTISSGNVTVTNANVTSITATSDSYISGLTVGKGAGSVSTNTAVGASALNANTTGSNNVSLGQNALLFNTSGSYNTGLGRNALYSMTTGSNNSAVGFNALSGTTTGNYNTAVGQEALNANTTASNNTAVGYQAGYSQTSGSSYATYVGWAAGYSTTGTQNTFIGQGAGYYVTSGAKNTILGGYSGNQGGIDIRTDSNNIVISDGDGNPRLYYDYVSASIGTFKVNSNTSADSTNSTFAVQNASGTDLIMESGNYSPVGISGVMRVSKYTGNSRSINAAGTINQNGADYAEYMVKSGDFVVAKGDVVGINAEGKLTNVFDEAISFCVKSTDPGLVGGDKWFTEPRPKDENGDEVTSETQAYSEWFARMEAARSTVDRIAFCGQVPVNVTGATAGQYIIPVDDNGAIKGEAVSNPTFEQYQQAVGKVIAIEQDGRALIIVKVA